MRTGIVPFIALAVVLVATGARAKGDDSIATEVTILSDSCLSLLDQVLDSYRLAVEPYEADGCNTTCLAHCETVVTQGIYAKYHEDCPAQSELTYCFNRFPSTWVQYVTLCSLFSFTNANAEAAAEAAAYGQPIYYNASREVNWTTTDAMDTNLRRLMSLGGAEAEGESGNTGCFPAFNDVDSFRVWMSGDYWEQVYEAPSNTPGIIVSVFFWVSLTTLGFAVRRSKV